jgi:hypothetical protein
MNYLADVNHLENIMKKFICLLACVSALFIVGCETSVVTDSGYHPNGSYGNDPTYRGELSEFDILGAASGQDASQANITKALETATALKIKRGDQLLIIQSGALVPDNEMMDEASASFTVAPFSGVPPADKTGMAASLRLRAAQGGYHYILCYWGVLESAQEDREGKAISWVPIAGSFVPDQKEQMRIRLKAILLDVATGNWKIYTPEVHNDALLTSDLSREEQNQKLVTALKTKGYKSLIAELLK